MKRFNIEMYSDGSGTYRKDHPNGTLVLFSDVQPLLDAVKEVPPNAIEGEAVVEREYHYGENGGVRKATGSLEIDLPAHLIGKRVKYLIWIEEGE